ncbi:hypothetical protein Dalk_0511 [Desulfatibacillum aliphaticivorans]|uniref:DAPG hydrolase PhiG domain-containing protein n=1 Tax=Desulfatibacillum aliphaticivorans TaxID=218208 RepID=B8FHD0_DESAL|nr:hypothetical protein [Desulfatibacillum aliphaticivorans]ACL02218.1 hypothetical protein Dalk_0511 [Desulfatibacillum aliphaticivorans]
MAAAEQKMSTSEQKEPYAEYFRRKPAGIPAETLRAIEKGPHSHALALPLEDINALLSPGYLDIETGFCNMPDGSVYVAVKTEMPKVTGDMLDWWFWWHPMQSLRYKIWFPQAHFSVSLDADLEEYSKRSGPYAERYWNTANFLREDVGAGAETFSIKFVRPSDFGFDESQFEKAGVATVVCGLVGSKSKHVKQHTVCCAILCGNWAPGWKCAAGSGSGRRSWFTAITKNRPLTGWPTPN